MDVRKEMGHALYMAQNGGKHKNTKILKGFGNEKSFRSHL
jgi:hypothetical protein